MQKVGVCFGGYCPMHRGHLDNIMMAKKENDVVIVAVCGYNNEPRAKELGLSLDRRFKLIKEFFKDDEIVRVVKVNDTELGIDESMSMENWNVWLRYVLGEASEQFLDKSCPIQLHFYVAEEKYQNDLNVLNKQDFFRHADFMFMPECEITLLPKVVDVSGTKVRQNPLKYWNYIIKPFRKFLTKNILVIGTASEGKTTLVRDISRYFDIPHIEEYGRTYMAARNMSDTDLSCHDFTEFLFHQRQELIDMEEAHENNKGVIISDTDNLITLMYAKAYANDPNINFTSEEYESLKALVKQHLLKGVYWDHIFMIPPGNKFVDDGTRYMKQSSIEERSKNYECLLEIIAELAPEYLDKMTVLQPGNYLYNYQTVKDYINGLLG